jgi:hypothetical protein
MNELKKRHEMTMKEVVYQIPSMKNVLVQPDIGYQSAVNAGLTLDLYRPPNREQSVRLPAVIFVSGFPDPGFEAMVGCKFKEMAGYISWGQLVAASGLVAVTYTNQDPVADLDTAISYLQQNAAALGLDENRFGIWAGSGNVPTALARLMRRPNLSFRAAVLCYGFMLDFAGSNAVANAAKSVGFANPAAGKSVDELPNDLGLMIVRAGRETLPGLNDSIDRFATAAIARNLPITVVNHATGPHAFDIVDDTELSREIVRAMLAFLRFHLLTDR